MKAKYNNTADVWKLKDACVKYYEERKLPMGSTDELCMVLSNIAYDTGLSDVISAAEISALAIGMSK